MWRAPGSLQVSGDAGGGRSRSRAPARLGFEPSSSTTARRAPIGRGPRRSRHVARLAEAGTSRSCKIHVRAANAGRPDGGRMLATAPGPQADTGRPWRVAALEAQDDRPPRVGTPALRSGWAGWPEMSPGAVDRSGDGPGVRTSVSDEVTRPYSSSSLPVVTRAAPSVSEPAAVGHCRCKKSTRCG